MDENIAIYVPSYNSQNVINRLGGLGKSINFILSNNVRISESNEENSIRLEYSYTKNITKRIINFYNNYKKIKKQKYNIIITPTISFDYLGLILIHKVIKDGYIYFIDEEVVKQYPRDSEQKEITLAEKIKLFLINSVSDCKFKYVRINNRNIPKISKSKKLIEVEPKCLGCKDVIKSYKHDRILIGAYSDEEGYELFGSEYDAIYNLLTKDFGFLLKPHPGGKNSKFSNDGLIKLDPNEKIENYKDIEYLIGFASSAFLRSSAKYKISLIKLVRSKSASVDVNFWVNYYEKSNECILLPESIDELMSLMDRK